MFIPPTISDISQIVIAFSALGALAFSIYNSIKIETIHRATNSMKDELVAEVRASSIAQGFKAGQESR